MDVSYLDQNKREYEITKHISLATLDPIALTRLKEIGECFVTLPEALFDARVVQDYPPAYNYNNEQDRFGQAPAQQAAE